MFIPAMKKLVHNTALLNGSMTTYNREAYQFFSAFKYIEVFAVILHILLCWPELWKPNWGLNIKCQFFYVSHYHFSFYCVDEQMASSVMLETQYWFVFIMIAFFSEFAMVNNIVMLQPILEMQKGYEAKNSKCQQRLEWKERLLGSKQSFTSFLGVGLGSVALWKKFKGKIGSQRSNP